MKAAAIFTLTQCMMSTSQGKTKKDTLLVLFNLPFTLLKHRINCTMMDYFTCALFLCLILLSVQFLQKLHSSKHLPPGPIPLPIIGNILQLGQNPHISLAKLSQKHGPIMLLKLGSLTTIVISSPDVAKEALQKNDKELSSRQVPDAAKACNYHLDSVAWLPATSQWKKLRRACTTHVFSAQKLKDGESIRRKKVDQLLEFVDECCSQKKAILIGTTTFKTIFNMMSNTLFSMDFANYDNDSSHEFEKLFDCFTEEIGRPNISDFFPTLRVFDVQGTRRKTTICYKKMFDIFDEIFAHRGASSIKSSSDVLDSLLGLEEAGELNRTEVRGLLLDLLVAGVGTSYITVEWAMVELLQNPQEMEKARKELDQVLGQGIAIQEQDIVKLPFLQAIVKETFRLHPPAPFLVPHKAETAVQISGFMVPKEAQTLINIWAIGRDPKIWSSPKSFMPERFLNCDIDFKGRDFELIPFGTGRRICPGLPLAHRMVHLVLASLIQSFDWKLEHDLRPEDLDMTEKFGLSLRKANPLFSYPLKSSV